MFIIFVYDIASEKRLPKVLKKSRSYLTWVQNSVLEGELTVGQFERFKQELFNIVDLDEDSLVFYTFRTKNYLDRQGYGVEKGGNSETLFF